MMRNGFNSRRKYSRISNPEPARSKKVIVPNKFKILLLSFSFILLASCAGAPKIIICLSNPAKGGFDCVDKNQKPFFLLTKDSENYICTDPAGEQALLEYFKRNKK